MYFIIMQQKFKQNAYKNQKKGKIFVDNDFDTWYIGLNEARGMEEAYKFMVAVPRYNPHTDHIIVMLLVDRKMKSQ